jgi:hypothetical protein
MLWGIIHTCDSTIARIAVGIGIFWQVTKPLLNDTRCEPILGIGLEARVAYRKILRTVIQATARHTARRHTPTEAPAFIKYAHGLTYLAKFGGTKQTRNSGSDDKDICGLHED